MHISEAGPSSAAGQATPEGARAEGAATPTRTGDTLHTHSVAHTAKRRVRGSQQKSGKKRQLEASSRAMAEEAEAAAGKHARTEPRPDT